MEVRSRYITFIAVLHRVNVVAIQKCVFQLDIVQVTHVATRLVTTNYYWKIRNIRIKLY